MAIEHEQGPIDALVLAGGQLECERFPAVDPAIGCKARIPILGRPMVEWTVRGLRAAPAIGRIVVVGDPALATPSLRELGAEVVAEAGAIDRNLRLGIEALPGARRILAASGDLPLITPEAVGDLLRHAPAADLVMTYVERADALREFPHREWIFAATTSGAYTGGGVALVRPDALLANWAWVQRVLDARRRSVLGLAMLIGPAFAVKALLRRLTVAEVEHKLSSLLNLCGRGYQTRYVELAMDVDKQTDVLLVEARLRARMAGGADPAPSSDRPAPA